MSEAWSVGEVFVLRHAGFPFDWLEGLGVSPAAQQCFDQLLVLEEQLVAVLQRGNPNGASAFLHAARMGKQPSLPPRADPEAQQHFSRWLTLRAEAEQVFRAERERLRHRLHELAADLRVQEAVFLSSPDMFENIWVRYARSPLKADNAASRRVERQVYSYLQRLCAKNETVSFFGPMGYGEIEGPGEDAAFDIRDPSRRTFLAYWAVEALAKVIATEPEIWRHLPWQINPIFRIDIESSQALCPSLDKAVSLLPEQVRLLERVKTVDSSELDATSIPLLKAGVLVRRLRFHTDSADVLGRLRDAVKAVPPSEAQGRWLGRLGELDSLRAEFETADLERRRALLPEIERLFFRLTGVPARRGEGALYADRFVLYEEASSPFHLRISAALGKRLGEALSDSLDVCAAQGGKVQRESVAAVNQHLGTTSRSIDFLQYAAALRDVSLPTHPPLKLERTSEGTLRVVMDATATPTVGPRYALPDVCLAQEQDGALQPVLARVHHHLLLPSWLFIFHSDRPRVERIAAQWLQEQPGEVALAELATERRNKAFYCFPGPRVVYTSSETLDRSPGVFPVGDLAVAVGTAEPRLETRDGRRLQLYLPLADFTTHVPYAALSHPLVLHAPVELEPEHTPRVCWSGAVYQRERWRHSLEDWNELSGFSLYLDMQRRRRRLHLPRFVFARVTHERKPFLVDTSCPFAVELLRHFARDRTEVVFEEMYPAPEQLWLRDDRGRYTFELRMQATRR